MIDLEQVRKLSPRDGDVFIVPADTDPEKARTFAQALSEQLNIRCFVVIGELNKVSLEQMNAAGWYRA